MIKRDSRVVLEVKGRRQEFEIAHAERLLGMPNNGGWHLPEDSNFQMTRINGLIHKRNTRKVKKSTE
jgi:hypothetical protein